MLSLKLLFLFLNSFAVMFMFLMAVGAYRARRFGWAAVCALTSALNIGALAMNLN